MGCRNLVDPTGECEPKWKTINISDRFITCQSGCRHAVTILTCCFWLKNTIKRIDLFGNQKIWSYQPKCRCSKALRQQLKASLLGKESRLVLSVQLNSVGKAKGFTGLMLGTILVSLVQTNGTLAHGKGVMWSCIEDALDWCA